MTKFKISVQNLCELMVQRICDATVEDMDSFCCHAEQMIGFKEKSVSASYEEDNDSVIIETNFKVNQDNHPFTKQEIKKYDITKIDEWDQFIKKYKPLKNHLNSNASFSGYMYETFGEEYKYIEGISINPKTSDRLWTICDENGVTFIQAGWHFVNRLGYVITEIPFNRKDEQFIID